MDKTLLWIPIANLVMLFRQINDVNKRGGKKKMQAGAICGGIVMASAVIQICITLLIPEIQALSGTVLAYFVPVVLNLLLVRLQEQKDSTQADVPPKKQKYIWIVVAVGIALVAVIAVVIVGAINRIVSMEIKDQNGPEDTSLAVLSQEDLVTGESCTMTGHSQKKYGNESQAGSKYEEVDGATVSNSFGKVSGVCTVHATKISAETLTLTITSTLELGNMELAVIVDGEYYCNVPINQTATIELKEVSGKLVLVRLAGESAKAEVTVSRAYAE